MKSLFKLILFFTVVLNASDEYYLVDEYTSKTKQESISKAFIELIQKDAVAIKKQNKKIKIVMVYPANQISDYWRKSKLSFEKRMKELKIDYELIDFFSKPIVEVKKQSQHLLSALKQNPDYLIFTLDVNKHIQFIERINAKKRTKLILQNITTPLKKLEDRQPFLYVGFDHFTGTKLLADYYIKKTNGKGNYAILYTTNGYVSFMRGKKFIDYVSSNSDLKVIHEYYTNTNKEKAKKATLDLLNRNSDIKFIYACSTDIAIGALEALKQRNLLGKIEVNGWGGGSEELKAIENSELDITVMRMNDDNGVAMAEAIKLDLENRANEIPTIYSGEFEVVKKGISKNRLLELKKKAFRYTLND